MRNINPDSKNDVKIVSLSPFKCEPNYKDGEIYEEHGRKFLFMNNEITMLPPQDVVDKIASKSLEEFLLFGETRINMTELICKCETKPLKK